MSIGEYELLAFNDELEKKAALGPAVASIGKGVMRAGTQVAKWSAQAKKGLQAGGSLHRLAGQVQTGARRLAQQGYRANKDSAGFMKQTSSALKERAGQVASGIRSKATNLARGAAYDAKDRIKSVASPKAWARGAKEMVRPAADGRIGIPFTGKSVDAGTAGKVGKNVLKGVGVLSTAAGTVGDLRQKEDPETGRKIGLGERVGKATGRLAVALPMAASGTTGAITSMVGGEIASRTVGKGFSTAGRGVDTAGAAAARKIRDMHAARAVRKPVDPAQQHADQVRASGGAPTARGV